MIPVVGPIIEIGKQLGNRAANKRKITELENTVEAYVVDLVPYEKKTHALISLKQTEHFILIQENADSSKIERIEQQIIELMEKNIQEKKSELMSKNATQLDIAKILKTIQQISHETSKDMKKVISETKMNTKLTNNYKEKINNETSDFQKKFSNKFDNQIKKLNEQSSDSLRSINQLKNNIEKDHRDYKKETNSNIKKTHDEFKELITTQSNIINKLSKRLSIFMFSTFALLAGIIAVLLLKIL